MQTELTTLETVIGWATGIVLFISTLLTYIWRREVREREKNTVRITDLENTTITEDHFNKTLKSLRTDVREAADRSQATQVAATEHVSEEMRYIRERLDGVADKLHS